MVVYFVILAVTFLVGVVLFCAASTFEDEVLPVILMVGVFVSFWSFGSGFAKATQELRTEAIELGVAHYEIVDSKGNTEFKWKEKEKE